MNPSYYESPGKKRVFTKNIGQPSQSQFFKSITKNMSLLGVDPYQY